jgi:adenylosuccinate synthase
MVQVGREFGTTTGRKRRCGWMDVPVVQYSSMINGYSSINITKLDVLTGLDELKIGVAYKISDRVLKPGEMPATLEELSKVSVVYESHPGWNEDISKARTFEELPKNAQSYVKRLETLIGIPVSWIGVGAGRYDMATKGFTLSR